VPHQKAIIGNFYLTTWIPLGACIQSTIYMIFSRPRIITRLLPFAILTYRITCVYLMQIGLIYNLYMDNLIPGAYTAQIPSRAGTATIGQEKVIIFMVGSCNNHPLGLFTQGAQETVTYSAAMKLDLERNKTNSRFLGVFSWISKERLTANKGLEVLYLSSLEGL
jgi:hypothetical protein